MPFKNKNLIYFVLALVLVIFSIFFARLSFFQKGLPLLFSELNKFISLDLDKIFRLTSYGPNIDLYSKEPKIRVGLFEKDTIKITSNKSFKIKAGKQTFSFSVNQAVNLEYEDGNYFLEASGKKVKLSDFPKAISKGYFEILDYEARLAWNPNINDNLFLGNLELRYNPKTKKTWVINELNLESYLLGVAETSSRSPFEFQKALSVAARSYALYIIDLGGKHKNEFFHVNSTASDQVYKGYGFSLRNPNWAKAVKETKGTVVSYKNRIALTPYFSHSDGRTRSWSEVWRGEVPYLISKPDPACKGMTLSGHGVGLSGYGALIMATEGSSFKEILEYYYSGVEIKKIYPSQPARPLIALAPREGRPPEVRLFEQKKLSREFFAYSKKFLGGLSLALGDLNGDGQSEIVTGAGKNGGPHLRVFDQNGKYLKWDVFAFHQNFTGGLDLATGDVDGDGKDEIGVCQAQEGQAWCKVYKYNKERTILFERNVFGQPECGASIALGDVDGDGLDEIIVGSGPGKANAQIKVFELNGEEKPISIFPFHPNFAGGLDIATGDLDQDGLSEIGVCQKASGEAWCKVYKYNWARSILAEWRAYPQGVECGASLALVDTNNDGKDEIITAPGPGFKPEIKIFNTSDEVLESFYAYDKNFRQGVNLAGGAF